MLTLPTGACAVCRVDATLLPPVLPPACPPWPGTQGRTFWGEYTIPFENRRKFFWQKRHPAREASAPGDGRMMAPDAARQPRPPQSQASAQPTTAGRPAGAAGRCPSFLPCGASRAAPGVEGECSAVPEQSGHIYSTILEITVTTNGGKPQWLRATWIKDILKVLMTEEEIRNGTQELGDQLYEGFQDKGPHVCGRSQRLLHLYGGPGPGRSAEKRGGVYRPVLL